MLCADVRLCRGFQDKEKGLVNDMTAKAGRGDDLAHAPGMDVACSAA
jgi:hypothetical protein